MLSPRTKAFAGVVDFLGLASSGCFWENDRKGGERESGGADLGGQMEIRGVAAAGGS